MSTGSPRDCGTVRSLWHYPVKSMAGVRLEEAQVAGEGILGDRAYAVIDLATGRVVSAKMPRKWAGLMGLAASFVEPPRSGAQLPPVRIDWPDGITLTSTGGEADARLSETLGRRVKLTTQRPESISLERLDPLHNEEVIEDIGTLMMAGRFSDYAAIHLVTTATLARLAELHPASDFDTRRFRPNLLIDSPEEEQGFVENEWVGRELSVGQDVRLRISDPTPRCSIPTLAQDGLRKDPQVLRTIVQHNRRPVPLLGGDMLPCVGVYAFVIRCGTIRSGDSVHIG